MTQEALGLLIGQTWAPEIMEMSQFPIPIISISAESIEIGNLLDIIIKMISVLGDYAAVIALAFMWVNLRENRRQLTQDRILHREQMEDMNQRHEQQMRIMENEARTKILRRKLIAAANNINYLCHNKSDKGVFRCQFVNSLGRPGLVCYVMWCINYDDRKGQESYTFDVYFSFLPNITHGELIYMLLDPLNWIYKATIIRRTHGYGEPIHGRNLKHGKRKYILSMYSNEFSTISNALEEIQALDKHEIASHHSIAAEIHIPYIK